MFLIFTTELYQYLSVVSLFVLISDEPEVFLPKYSQTVILHGAHFWRVVKPVTLCVFRVALGPDTAKLFVLRTFRTDLSPTIQYMYKFGKENSYYFDMTRQISDFDKSTMCNIDIIICVACTINFHWLLIPTQSKENA